MEHETHAEHQGSHHAHSSKKEDFHIPLAIVIAGVIIGGAIFYSNGAHLKTTLPEQQLSAPKFSACLASGKYADRVQKDFANGVNVGVRGTPFSMVWNRKTGKQMTIEGAYPLVNVKNTLESVISSQDSADTDKSTQVPVAELSLRSDDHVLGNPNADVLIIEYSDTECPFCKQFHETMHQVMDQYGKDGKVAWVYRHSPIDQLHPKARKEAEALECANEQGGNDAFWKYADKLFEITPSNNGLDAAQLPVIAAMIGLK